jgi:hypothetical protein
MANSKKTLVKMDKEYQAKWDLDTLRQAREIEANKARMIAAQNYAKEQVKMLGGIVSGTGKAPAKKSTSKKK